MDAGGRRREKFEPPRQIRRKEAVLLRAAPTEFLCAKRVLHPHATKPGRNDVDLGERDSRARSEFSAGRHHHDAGTSRSHELHATTRCDINRSVRWYGP